MTHSCILTTVEWSWACSPPEWAAALNPMAEKSHLFPHLSPSLSSLRLSTITAKQRQRSRTIHTKKDKKTPPINNTVEKSCRRQSLSCKHPAGGCAPFPHALQSGPAQREFQSTSTILPFSVARSCLRYGRRHNSQNFPSTLFGPRDRRVYVRLS